MRHAILPGLLALLTSCTSVEWAKPAPELPAGWRHYKLFVSDAAYVLARDEDAAAEAHELAAEARGILAAELDCEPARGLILALSMEDPLPMENPHEYGRALREWTALISGSAAPPPHMMELGSTMKMGPGSESVEVDPALLLHLMGAPIPRDQTRLDLPPALVERAAFLTILPTSNCLETASEAMVDIMCEAQGISTAALWTASLIVGHPATMLHERCLKHAKIALYQAWVPSLTDEPAPERVFAAMQRAGLADENAKWSPPPPPVERSTDVGAFMDQHMKFAAEPPRFVVRERPAKDLMHLMLEVNWQGYVDTGISYDHKTASMLKGAGKKFLHLPMRRIVPTRADAEALAAFYDELARERKEPFVFVYGDQEIAAALVASHARYVLGKSDEEVLEIAEHYGAGLHLHALREIWGSTK